MSVSHLTCKYSSFFFPDNWIKTSLSERDDLISSLVTSATRHSSKQHLKRSAGVQRVRADHSENIK